MNDEAERQEQESVQGRLGCMSTLPNMLTLSFLCGLSLLIGAYLKQLPISLSLPRLVAQSQAQNVTAALR